MVTIRPATRTDAPAVATLLSEAFRDDPAWSITLPNDRTRAAKLTAHYRHRVRSHPGWVDVATDGSGSGSGSGSGGADTAGGDIVGAVLWEPPADPGVVATARRAVTGGALWLWGRLPIGRGARHTHQIEAYRPTAPHWYIRDIGTAARARGRGVGSALIEYRLDVIDRSEVPLAFLESTTPGSRRLYERYGFEAVGSVPTVPGASSTAMVRRGGVR